MTKQQKPKASVGGRPPYRPSIKDRETVEQMKFCGESHIVIARSLGLDVRTMEKHFVDELENGHANRRREVIGWMFEAAAKGNASIQKHLDNLGRIAGSVERVEQRAKGKEPAIGKKEARQAAADSVTGKFAAPAGPKLIVNNH